MMDATALAPVLVTPPAAPLLGLDEAKAHLRVDHDEEDLLISSLIDAATAHLDGWTGVLGRALVTQTWRQDFPRFITQMRLPLAPVQSIESVTYYDSDNAQQSLDAATYALRADGLGAYVELAPDQSWPSTYGRAGAASVTYVAGYGPAASVPAPIRQAALLLVGHWYRYREAVVVGASAEALPMAVGSLIAPYRRAVV